MTREESKLIQIYNYNHGTVNKHSDDNFIIL